MEVVDILREGVGVALRIGAPLLILSMLVGILVAIFQAVIFLFLAVFPESLQKPPRADPRRLNLQI